MRVVVSALVNIGGKYLLCLRGAGAFPFSWEFPTVELEDGETVEDALETFLFGELGLKVAFKKIRSKFMSQVAEDHFLFYLVETEVVGGCFTIGMYQDARLVDLKKSLHWNLSPFTLRQACML